MAQGAASTVATLTNWLIILIRQLYSVQALIAQVKTEINPRIQTTGLFVSNSQPQPTAAPAIVDAPPLVAVLPGVCTSRSYQPPPASTQGTKRQRRCKKCLTVLNNIEALASNTDFADFAAALNSRSEKPIRVSGYGHCHGCNGRCPRFKRKLVHSVTSRGNSSKKDFHLANLRPRVHVDGCVQGPSCNCDDTDTDS